MWLTRKTTIAGLVLIIVALVISGRYLADSISQQKLMQALQDSTSQVTSGTLQEETTSTGTDPSETVASQPGQTSGPDTPATPSASYVFTQNPLSELFSRNSDLVGWLAVTGTRIDYPVVKGRDNAFYLDRNFDRQPSAAGSIFMDYRNVGDGQDRNTIIYGHRMRNQTMFYDLERFKDPGFYRENRTITWQTLYGVRTYRVFAAYETSPAFNYIQTRFADGEFISLINEIRKRSLHEWDTKVTAADQILTLSTCTRSFEDARFVVHAVLIETDQAGN